MPKMKTHRGAAKRFKVTGSGKIRRRKAFRAHLLEHKATKRTRRLKRGAEVTGGDKKHVERLLGRRLTRPTRPPSPAAARAGAAPMKESVPWHA